MLILSNEDIEKLFPVAPCLEDLEDAYSNLHKVGIARILGSAAMMFSARQIPTNFTNTKP